MILSKVLSKFQVTLPKEIVKALHIQQGDMLRCEVHKNGVIFKRLVVEEPYSEEELEAFTRLYQGPSNKGKQYKSRQKAMAHLRQLRADD